MEENLDIFNSVKSKALNDLTAEILEISLDAVLNNETLKSIPIVGLAFKGFSLYQNISEAFFIKKLLTFLFKLNEIPYKTRIEFVNKLESERETRKAGEKLLITLNRLDDIDKSAMIGNLFKHTILGSISYEDFGQLSHMIDNSYVNDLKKLIGDVRYIRLDDSTLSRLFKNGFFDKKISDVKKQLELQRKIQFDQNYNGIIQPKFIYMSNRFAEIFAKYAFDSVNQIE